jgi:hypothetical protein
MNVTRADLQRHALLPLGELHPENCCALCGWKYQPLKQTVLVSTRARGMRCLDSVACVRRRQRLAA